MTQLDSKKRHGLLSTVRPMLRQRKLGIALVAAPGLTAAVAILTAMESSLAVVAALNVATGVIISSVLFIALSLAAEDVTEERVNLVKAAERGFWRARVQMVSIQDEESGLHTDWYFRLRLQEEVSRSMRYGMQFALLVIRPFGMYAEADVASAGAWFAEHIQRHLRKSDLPAMLQDGTSAVLMANTGRKAAEAVRRRVLKDLAHVDPRVGIAYYPIDGETPDELIAAAAQSAAPAVTAGAA